MGFTDQERARNIQASQQQLGEDVDAFLDRYASLNRGFSANDFGASVRSERIERRAAHRILMQLKEQGRVHYLAGRWRVGPLPPEG
jgi:hypothetical protein